jgi:hypothetical protein
MTRQLLFVLTVVLCAPVVSAGQTLVDVARAEEARRKSVKVAGKVYTNESLKPDFTTPPPPPPSAAPAPAAEDHGHPGQPAPPPSAGAAGAGEPQARATTRPVAQAGGSKAAAAPAEPAPKSEQGEAYWRNLMSTARADLQRSEMFLEALQSRINALTTDFVNRDDPAQRAVIEQDRKKALTELERVRTEIADRTKAIADLEEQARKAGVPAGWLR